MRFWSADVAVAEAELAASEPVLSLVAAPPEPVAAPCSAEVRADWIVDATLALTELAEALVVPADAAVAFASRPWTTWLSFSAAAAATATALGAAGCSGGGPDGPLTAPLPVALLVDVLAAAALAAPAAAAVFGLFASTWMAAICAVKRLSVFAVASAADVAAVVAALAAVAAWARISFTSFAAAVAASALPCCGGEPPFFPDDEGVGGCEALAGAFAGLAVVVGAAADPVAVTLFCNAEINALTADWMALAASGLAAPAAAVVVVEVAAVVVVLAAVLAADAAAPVSRPLISFASAEPSSVVDAVVARSAGGGLRTGAWADAAARVGTAGWFAAAFWDTALPGEAAVPDAAEVDSIWLSNDCSAELNCVKVLCAPWAAVACVGATGATGVTAADVAAALAAAVAPPRPVSVLSW